ncbi:MAG TPA: c-type cytochrome [Stellaceae bacterium]|nr:c-type cytochrome [Stellaceae bacterium]
MKRLSKVLAAIAVLLAGGAIVGVARVRAVIPDYPPPLDRRLPPWGGALLGLAILAAAVITGSEYLLSQEETLATAKIITGGDPSRAPWLFARYGCGGCHTIPGVPGADGKVGPTLQGLFERVYIGGTAENKADNLVGWITNPPQFSPHTAMPPTGISAAEARDIAAYLYTH